MQLRSATRRVCLIALALLAACHHAPSQNPKDYGQAGTQAAFDLEADLTIANDWYQQPWPSDLRLDGSGHPDYSGFPNPRHLPMVESFRGIAMQTHGFSVIPTAYFLFDAPIVQHALEAVPANGTEPVFLVDVDATSPEKGKFFPILLETPPAEINGYVPDNLLAVAPRPGIILTARRTYAFVIMRSLKDAAGNALGVPSYLDMLRQGVAPTTARGAAALALYAPLFSVLNAAHIDSAQVAAATVFTTGDEVADDAALYDRMLEKYSVTIDQIGLDAVNSAGNDRVCRLTANVTYPQFQQGAPPFNTQGLFVFGADGLPIQQRTEVAPMVILLPRRQMPAAGYPVMQYFHGSGGYANEVVDTGPTLVVGGQPTPNQGPGWVHAESNIASFGGALPVNPERLVGAGETAYLNLQNPAAMRDTFRQGVFEQRMLLRAMLALKIPPAMVANCPTTVNGNTVPIPTLPSNATAFGFDAGHIIAEGQSMGGMYTNLFAAVEPKVKIAVPTGAGGYWTYFILQTHLLGDVVPLLAALLATGQPLTQMHPVMHLLQTGWEPNDPFIAIPRVSRRPLPGHPARPIYEPVGKDDQYFPTQLYDAIALAYGHEEAGDIQWPSMQAALALSGFDGIVPFPVAQNLKSANGSLYTGVVEQFLGDGIEKPHSIYRQLPAVKYQYRCFVDTWLRTGVATVSAPAAQEAACP